MNEGVRRALVAGSAWSARVGIRGIRAARLGADQSRAYAAELAEAIGAYDGLTHITVSTDLPPMHVMEIGRMVLIWVAGAQSRTHGEHVLNGLVETYESAGMTQVNVLVGRMMVARMESHVVLRDRVDHVVLFGHSYGAVCVEAYAAEMARLYPSVEWSVTTYGSPRTCIPGRLISQPNIRRRRIVSELDIVPHVPYTHVESPIAWRVTPSRYRQAFDHTGHTCSAMIFRDDGTFSRATNNTVSVRESALAIVQWATYMQHVTHRAHEEATYVALMDAWASRDEGGRPPTEDVPTGPTAPPPTENPVVGADVSGEAPTPAQHAEYLRQKELLAEQMASAMTPPEPARPVSVGSVHGVQYRGSLRVEASDRRAARTAARRLNRLRRILAPCSTDQRAQMLEALELDIEGPV